MLGPFFADFDPQRRSKFLCQTIHCWNYYCSILRAGLRVTIHWDNGTNGLLAPLTLVLWVILYVAAFLIQNSPLILEDVLENPHEKSSDSCAKQAKPMELPFANLWEIDSVLWKITMFKRCLS